MAIARIADKYPCFLLVWQDFFIIYLTFFIYLTRGFIHYFQYEWVHERVKYFNDHAQVQGFGGKANAEKREKAAGFFHRHRRWIEKKNLLRNCVIIIVVFLVPMPLFASIKMADRFRTIDSGEVCDDFHWGDSITFVSIFSILTGFFLSFKARKAYDVHNTRKDLIYALYVTTAAFVVYTLSTVTEQFGISKKFPFSSFASSLLCLGLNYFSGWLPVASLKERGYERERSSFSSRNVDVVQQVQLEKPHVIHSGRFKEFFDYIGNPVGYAAFHNYLMKAYAIENIYFANSVIHYESKATAKLEKIQNNPENNEDAVEVAFENERNELLKSALSIYNEYMIPDAILWVNVSYAAKAKYDFPFKEAIEAGNLEVAQNSERISWHPSLSEIPTLDLPSIFTSALLDVLVLLVDDLFRSFKNTIEFEQSKVSIWQASPLSSPTSRLTTPRHSERRRSLNNLNAETEKDHSSQRSNERRRSKSKPTAAPTHPASISSHNSSYAEPEKDQSSQNSPDRRRSKSQQTIVPAIISSDPFDIKESFHEVNVMLNTPDSPSSV
jgi:hypothetical protein